MRTENLLPILSLHAFYDFAKLDINDKVTLLKKEGVFLDQDSEKGIITCLYFLQGFFVEIIYSQATSGLLHIIPFKQGYKIGMLMNATKKHASTHKTVFECCAN